MYIKSIASPQLASSTGEGGVENDDPDPPSQPANFDYPGRTNTCKHNKTNIRQHSLEDTVMDWSSIDPDCSLVLPLAYAVCIFSTLHSILQ